MVLAVLAVVHPAPRAQSAPSTSQSLLLHAAPASLAPVVDAVAAGVVGISIAQGGSAANPLLQDPEMRRFFEQGREGRPGRQDPAAQVRPAGSGVVIDAARGLVLTNHHVIKEASRIVVVLKDRREVPAELVGSDAGTDLALLRIRADRLTAVRIGDSDAMRVGDFVLAIGNPFGLGQTVTTGIVSATGRGISPEGYEDYIQTDAAINPGNSGGALVNLRGELIGINTAILSGRGAAGGGNIGIGFAVPTSMAREVVAQLTQYGEVRRGRIGVQLDEVTQDIAARRGLPEIAGALVQEVSRGSPAERAGLRANDIVLQVNGRPVRTSSDLRNRVALIPVGSAADMQVWRDGRRVAVRVPVAAISSEQVARAQDVRPSPGGGAQPSVPGSALLQGMRLAPGRDGLVVSGVAAGSPAHAAGFRNGDVIVAVDRQAVTTVQELSAHMARPGTKSISVLRGDSKLRLHVG